MKRTTLFSVILTLLAVVLYFNCAQIEPPVEISSPDGNVIISLNLNENGAPVYSVSYMDTTIITPSPLGLQFKKTGVWSDGLEIKKLKRTTIDDTYDVVAGKSKTARDYCKELVVSLQEKESPNRQINVILRAYNDGAAFRYVIPPQAKLDSFEIVQEKTEFHFANNVSCWALLLDHFNTSYESEYIPMKLNEITNDTLVGLPLTMQMEDGPTCALTEANLTNYAGMYVKGSGDNALISTLSPLPDADSVCVRATAPAQTPWRVLMVGEQPGDLIESDIILNLNEPLAIEDPSWIEPGLVAWDWWSGQMAVDPPFERGMNNATMKHYIDFAAEGGFKYMLIDAGWYGQHRDGSADITTMIPEIDIPGLVEYAGEKNVDILIWLNWNAVKRQMDEAFPLYEDWGVKGVKIDYMNRDDQEMVNFYHKAVKKAAEHHLCVDFHGAYKPTGFRRTYPNLMTREGVLGLEYLKWSDRADPEHNVTIPFTRMVAGPMDYTPGAFTNVTKENFTAQGEAPMAMGTRCHQLAMYVVYESQLQMVSDYPENYINEPGFEFIKKVPAAWDETRVLSGKIGDYVVIARKKGDNWYVGAMTDWNARTLPVLLNFLDDNEYDVQIFADGPAAEDMPERVSITETIVTSKDELEAELAPGGGYAAVFTPIQ